MTPSRFLSPAILLALLLLAACAPAPTDAPVPAAAPPPARPRPRKPRHHRQPFLPHPSLLHRPQHPVPPPPPSLPQPPQKPHLPPKSTPTQKPTATKEATPTPSAPEATAKKNANLRGGPGTNYDIVGSIKAGDSQEITGVVAIGGYNWYKLENGGWVRGNLVETTNKDQIPTIPQADIPPTPTPRPATPTPEQPPTPEAPPTTASEVINTNYVWSFVPNSDRNNEMATRQIDLLNRGGAGTSPSSIGVVGREASLNVVVGQMEGGGFYSASNLFLIGKVDGPVVERSGFLYMTIQCLDGSTEEIEIDMHIDSGIVVSTKDITGSRFKYQTGIKVLTKGLFKPGDYVGFSISTNPDSYNYGSIDHSAVLLFD